MKSTGVCILPHHHHQCHIYCVLPLLHNITGEIATKAFEPKPPMGRPQPKKNADGMRVGKSSTSRIIHAKTLGDYSPPSNRRFVIHDDYLDSPPTSKKGKEKQLVSTNTQRRGGQTSAKSKASGKKKREGRRERAIVQEKKKATKEKQKQKGETSSGSDDFDMAWSSSSSENEEEEELAHGEQKARNPEWKPSGNKDDVEGDIELEDVVDGEEIGLERGCKYKLVVEKASPTPHSFAPPASNPSTPAPRGPCPCSCLNVPQEPTFFIGRASGALAKRRLGSSQDN